MSKLTLPKILLIIVAAIIVIGVAWYAFGTLATTPRPSASPSVSPSPTQTPETSALPSPSAAPSSTNNPTSNPSSSTLPTPPTPSNTVLATPNPSSTSSPTPIVTATPIPVGTPTPTAPSGTTVTFDFDSGTPAPALGRGTPFSQTINGVTAYFSSPQDTIGPAFSTQNANSLGGSQVVNSTKFSGLFLWPSNANRNQLIINFSGSLTSISMFFKTVETNDPGPGGTGSSIKLAAYLNSVSTPVGSPVTVNGKETLFDVYPEGTLAFNSSGQPFNMAMIELPFSANGASGFLIDNVVVVTA